MPDLEADREIRDLSPNAKNRLSHVTRNGLQEITGHAQMAHDILLTEPVKTRFERIMDAVETLSNELRRLGI